MRRCDAQTVRRFFCKGGLSGQLRQILAETRDLSIALSISVTLAWNKKQAPLSNQNGVRVSPNVIATRTTKPFSIRRANLPTMRCVICHQGMMDQGLICGADWLDRSDDRTAGCRAARCDF
jgi:hypothetical protein